MNHKPKRILQVVTYMGRGGIETMLMNYYRHIDRSKVQFDFLVHRDFAGDFDEEILSLGGKIYRVRPMNPLNPGYWHDLLSFFCTHPYEIVHCHLNFKSGVVLAAAKLAGVPIRIAHAHTASMEKDWTQIPRKIMRTLIAPNATAMLACSQNAGEAIFGKHPFCFFFNAMDGAAFRYQETVRSEKRLELSLADTFTVMHVGRFGAEKNHRFLLDVFARLREVEPNAKLVLIGDGTLRKEVEETAKRMFTKDAVRFLGVRTDISELLQAADVFAFPSIFEGLPVTMIEAQAAGLPCVMSDTVTDECIVTDLVTALPIDDPKAWAEEILKKRGTPRTDRLEEIRAAGYDITAAAEKLTRFYLNGETI